MNFLGKLRPLDHAKRQADRRYKGLPMHSGPPPLLSVGDLQGADVFFCYGSKETIPWWAITYGSSGPYVHVAIYLANGWVAEATPKGVVKTDIGEFLSRYLYVAATRCPGVHGIPDLMSKVEDFCHSNIRVNTKYDYLGAVLSPLFEFVELKITSATRMPFPIKWPRRKNRTFCSQFVLDAFVDGGYVPDDDWCLGARSPTALAEDNIFELLGYLSQSGEVSLLSNDLFWTGGG